MAESLPESVSAELLQVIEANQEPGERDAAVAQLAATHPAWQTAIQERYSRWLAKFQSEEVLPEQIGPYEIVGLLGAGGMGRVYRARQYQPLRREVAVKVIKRGMDSRDVLNRFGQERQALALMDHPAVATVLDAGITEVGQPFFVMELVDGMPLTDYCDGHRMRLEDRIRVFQQVCYGVQHAHQKGVLHRDLKPANILVARKDDQHVVKIIDFGLARAVDQPLVENTIYTEQGQLIGTPEYMSPEQARGSTSEVDTRTDVYSLGVTLYELLAAELPFPSSELRAGGLFEAHRIIAETEPVRPSSRVSQLRAAAADVAHHRGTTPRDLGKQLRGDLDWIVMMAMAKEPDRRYGSAAELAGDLDRYLANDPVDAGPPSNLYRLRKLTKRYRTESVFLALLLVSLIVGVVATWAYASDAQRQRQAAEGENRRFNRLAVAMQLEQALLEEKLLYPAWPTNIERLQRWMRERGEPLSGQLGGIQQTLDELRTKARLLPEARRAERRAHPRFDEFRQLKRRLAALTRADQIRRGRRHPEKVVLPAGITGSPMQMNNYAWQRASCQRQIFGEEALGLAAIRAVLRRAQRRDHARPNYLTTLAFALHANGLDKQATRAMEECLQLDPTQVKWRRYAKELRTSMESCDETLALAWKEWRALEEEVFSEFPSDADRFLFQALRRTQAQLERFTGIGGAKESVRKRLAWAQSLRDLPGAQVSWAEARNAIAKADGAVASRRYAEHPISLPPQTGLVPIGMNPRTKLWEFLHLRSVAAVDPGDIEVPQHRADGSIPVTPASGIIFVLVPGGTFTMGSQRKDRAAPQFDPRADDRNFPHPVVLAPFFLARHEVTQAQWIRLAGPNPSTYAPTAGVELHHPVEHVRWGGAKQVLGRYGLTLPTEAQWEYCCRAGTSTVFYSGDSASSLAGYENLNDKTSWTRTPSWATRPRVMFDDGHQLHAPVGSFRANPFGFFDMSGNVSEWCREHYADYMATPQQGDGMRVTHVGTSGVAVRGGNFGSGSFRARSAARCLLPPLHQGNNCGLRAARALEPGR